MEPVALTLLVICAQFIPESARFNVSTGNTQAALNTLESIAKMNRSVMPEGQLVEPILVSHIWVVLHSLSSTLDRRGPMLSSLAPGGKGMA
jgi:hypothetical protein